MVGLRTGAGLTANPHPRCGTKPSPVALDTVGGTLERPPLNQLHSDARAPLPCLCFHSLLAVWAFRVLGTRMASHPASHTDDSCLNEGLLRFMEWFMEAAHSGY